jgi:quinolinate synthase
MKPSGVSLPKEYLGLSEKEVMARIQKRRGELGSRLVILAHHYQRKEVVALSDFRGDSYGLSKKASQQSCELIAFCGVHFMAESADVLTRDNQKIFLPNMAARCPMADMADMADVEVAWEGLTEVLGPGQVLPVLYINSVVELKAFCGRQGGSVCTSSNARAVMEWALRQGKRILFLPDEHLGRNTAKRIGIPKDESVVWDPGQPRGGIDSRDLGRARLILWKGHCHVHTWFSVEHIQAVREAFPDVKIVVHPECREEVVDLADASGSTEFIVNYVQGSPPGSVIAVGTEINLVNRLAMENPGKRVFELSRSLCPNMFRINLNNLLWTLETFDESTLVRVDPLLKPDARTALDRMLRISEDKK